ncbi:MAG TPA: DUF2652 domain-containing protein [Anaerolineales bacterium]|nr:DUF2652 domain-containing protein [Anaerolineales bacterium]
MAQKGYFLLTDISGYTEFLTESELEHAHETLQSLFEVQLANIKFPLKISGFRGDAIFVYTAEACFVNPQSFIETLENLYIVFADTLRQMQINTTCECRACRNMGKLDLKMCIHYGEYIVQKLGDREELLGADVIVPHRMLKNTAIEKTGVKAYALFSQAAADTLRLAELSQPLIPHSETYEHLGELKMLVYDLHGAMEREEARKHILVNPATAWIHFELDIPFPPSLIWDYFTTPALEGPVLGLNYVKRVDELGGRTGPGARFHCAHASGDFFNQVVDWKPFDYFTVQQIVAGLQYHRTIRLDYDGAVTKFRFYVSQPDQEAPEGFREFLESAARQGYERLPAFIQADLQSGKISPG